VNEVAFSIFHILSPFRVHIDISGH
jgi:hypothetical protein